jgi:hypothetical protein
MQPNNDLLGRFGDAFKEKIESNSFYVSKMDIRDTNVKDNHVTML